jgi:hypothetical protein
VRGGPPSGAAIVRIVLAARLACGHSATANEKNILPIRSRKKPITVVS